MRPVVTLAAFGIIGCGIEPPPAPVTDLFPIAVGHVWTFKITESDGTTNQKVQTITGTVATSFGPAFTFETGRNNDIVTSVQFIDAEGRLMRVEERQVENGIIIERLRYEPPSLRVHLDKTATGDTYEATHDEVLLGPMNEVLLRSPKTNHFVIDASDELVTVPAGTFRAVKVRRQTVGGTEKTFWYAFGVGKVKEIGGQTEELESFSLAEGVK